MAETDVLREFLVALGFKVDSAQYKKFTDSVTGSTHNVEKLGTAAAAAVIGTTAAIAKVSEVMDKLYYVSQRTGSSVSSIMAFDYGVSQLGGSADAAQASLENLGHFIRAYPGSGQFLTQLGVAPEHVKDAAAALKDLIPILKAMPQYQGLAYANMLGMDEKTFLALTSGDLTKQMDDYNKRLATAGVNGQDASEKGKALMQALRGAGAEAEILGAALEEKLGPGLTLIIKLLDQALNGLALFVTDSDKASNNLAHALREVSPNWMYSSRENPTGAPPKDFQASTASEKPSDTRSPDEKRKWLMDYFRSKGWSDAAAGGIVNRLYDESKFDPSAKGDKGTAYGLFQAHKDWRRDFKNTMGKDIFGSSLEDQAQFLDMALKGQTNSKDADAMRTGALLKNARTDTDAYRLFNGGFEKSASGVAAINSTVNITIPGAGNPSAVGAAVADKQNDVNKNLIRMSSGVPQ